MYYPRSITLCIIFCYLHNKLIIYLISLRCCFYGTIWSKSIVKTFGIFVLIHSIKGIESMYSLLTSWHYSVKIFRHKCTFTAQLHVPANVDVMTDDRNADEALKYVIYHSWVKYRKLEWQVIYGLNRNGTNEVSNNNNDSLGTSLWCLFCPSFKRKLWSHHLKGVISLV